LKCRLSDSDHIPCLKPSPKKKFSCPSCGGESQWNPAKKLLVCPFCGTTSPAQAELSATGGEVIVEHDLAAALRGIPDDQRGWQAKKTSVKCQSCQAISVFDAERVGQRCDFCGSSALVPYEEIKEAFRPESLLPMKISENVVRDSIRRWYGSRWFAPNQLKRAALTDTVKGLYIPYWTFDAQVHADWTAESGYYYYETETTPTRTAGPSRGRCRRLAGNRAAGRWIISLTTNSYPPPAGCSRKCCGKSSRSPQRRNWCRTMRAFCRGGSWSDIRSTW